MSTSRFFAKRFFANGCLGGVLSITLLAVGCGGNPACNVTGVPGVNVTPTTASVNHVTASPGNTQVFLAQATVSACGNVAVTAALVNSNWTANDPSVQLSVSPNTQVTATCTTALASPVTITATDAGSAARTGHATLTCQ